MFWLHCTAINRPRPRPVVLHHLMCLPITLLVWPDDGYTVQPKHVATVHNEKSCVLTEILIDLIIIGK